MPVLGHAVAGWALAVELRPWEESALARGRGAAFWTPSLIALAFLPDVASQAAVLAGASDPTPFTHSLVLSAGVAVLLALAIGWWAGLRLRRALLLALLLIPGHVILDLMQSPGRPAFWPMTMATIGLPRPLLPETARGEALISALVVAALAWRHRARSFGPGSAAPPFPRYLAMAVTAAIVSLAGTTHYLRGVHETRYEEALARLAEGDAAAALRLADEADGWPHATPPGRLDYLRAEARVALQDREGAARDLRRSVAQDPGYFWARADLCLAEATAAAPADARRRETLPCLRELRARFPDHPDVDRMAGRAERALSTPAPPASTPAPPTPSEGRAPRSGP